MSVDRVCQCCGEKFKAKAADVKRGWARFCSKRCKARKQEAATGQHARWLAGAEQRLHDADMEGAEEGWDSHKAWT